MHKIHICGVASVNKYNQFIIICNAENIHKISHMNYKGKAPIYRNNVVIKLRPDCLIFNPELTTDITTLVGKKIEIDATIQTYSFSNKQGWNIYADIIETA